MNAQVNDTRAKFEDFAMGESVNVKHDSAGGYQTKMAEIAYRAWLAAKCMYEPVTVTSSNRHAERNPTKEG